MSDKISKEIIAAAKKQAVLYGVPASLALAQWALESGWGKKDMGAHNYFGMKYVPTRHKGFVERDTKEHFGQWTTIKAKFAKFASAEECFDDYGKLVGTHKIYKKVQALKPDPNAMAHALTGLYATDPQYGSKLVSIMKSNDLYKHDDPKCEDEEEETPKAKAK